MRYVPVLFLFACGYGMFASVACNSVWDIISKANENMFETTKKKGRMLSDPNPDAEYIKGGDILIDPSEPNHLKAGIGGRALSNSPKDPNFNWHNKIWMERIIPFEMSEISSKAHRAIIVKSLGIIRDQVGGCLQFKPKVNGDKWWLSFWRGQGCYSGIGRKFWVESARTRVSLGFACMQTTVIIHEVLHALGFPHEQSRRDRDDYVKIYSYRIQKKYMDNFDMNSPGYINTMGTPYDYKSIMHYTYTSFAIDPTKGNTIENKYDPNYPLSSKEMSAIDVVELKALYQCRSGSGWSPWYGWNECLCNWQGVCSKANVRICIGTDKGLCPGVNDYGTDARVKSCSKAEGDKALAKKDGHWGKWSAFTKCDSSCGWGFQSRTRQCNNPVPSGGGKSCGNYDRQRIVCRKPRCSASNFDEHFEKATTNWVMKDFSRKRSSVYRDSGPKKDHTSGRGYFAAAWGKDETTAKLTSRKMAYKRKRCLTFDYMLDGQNLNKDGALVVYLKPLGGGTADVIFTKKGHQGNYWIRAAVDIERKSYGYQIVIMAKMDRWRTSIIGIDDIFIDNDACPVGLVGCKDNKDQDCRKRGINGECTAGVPTGRNMVLECCATCQDKRYRDKKSTDKSGKRPKPKPKVTKPKPEPKPKPKPTKATSCIDKPNESCFLRAKKGQCKKYTNWMYANCCDSCRCIQKYSKGESESCSRRVKLGQCTKYFKWMSTNCCYLCRNTSG